MWGSLTSHRALSIYKLNLCCKIVRREKLTIGHRASSPDVRCSHDHSSCMTACQASNKTNAESSCLSITLTRLCPLMMSANPPNSSERQFCWAWTGIMEMLPLLYEMTSMWPPSDPTPDLAILIIWSRISPSWRWTVSNVSPSTVNTSSIVSVRSLQL